MRVLLLFMIGAFFSFNTANQNKTVSADEVLTNEDIINMVQSKVSRKIIELKIKTSPNEFDLSSAGLVQLKTEKVSDNIVLKMFDAYKEEINESLTNQMVIDMISNKVSNKIILLRIERSENKFDSSSDALIELKRNKVWDSIIVAIMEDGKHEKAISQADKKEEVKIKFKDPELSFFEKIENPGIYHFDNYKNQLVKLDPRVIEQLSASSGIVNAKIKAGLNNADANFKFNSDEVSFYFITNYQYNPDEEVNRNRFEVMESPNELSLAKFRVSHQRNRRDLEIGNISGLHASYGVRGSYSVKFKYERLSNQIFKIYFEKPLAAGQYCFIPAVTSIEDNEKIVVYDFGIEK